MVSPAGDGGSPAPIDRPILEFLQMSLGRTQQVERSTISDATGHLELTVLFESSYYPPSVAKATLSIWWNTNDDFKIHYQEEQADTAWKCRWDRHPNSHNTRDYFHPLPKAQTPGENASWPSDYRDVVRVVLDDVEERITHLWAQ